MKSRLGNYVGDELYALWQEFEGQQTAEARFVKAVDKLECVIQKNQQSVDSGRGASGYFEKLAGLCASDAMLSDFYAQVVDQVRRTGRDID
jgi:5'-deoxynucleotidase YfbR-like HD superfamily hydrolase